MVVIKDRTAPERVARNKAKNLAAGFVRVNVWIPADKREQLLEYVRGLRGN